MSVLRVTLPDGSQREAAAGTTPRQIAESIGAGLARAAVAARVNGEIWDLDRPLEADAQVAILTERDPDALPVLRHSSAHILATAVRELFPNAGIGFGPPIEDGFYYDFQVDRALHARGPAAARGQDGRGRCPRFSLRSRGGGSSRGQSPLCR